MSDNLLPTFRIGSVHRTIVAGGYSRASAAKTQQLTLAALLKSLVFTIPVHLSAGEQVIQVVSQRIAHLTLHTTASVAGSVTKYREMSTTAVTSIVYDVIIRIVGRIKQTMLILKQRPQMVLQTKIRVRVLVLHKLVPTEFHHFAILFRRATNVTASTVRTIACKSKHISMMFNNYIDQTWNFLIIPPADCRHDRYSHSCMPDYRDCLQSFLETAMPPYAVVSCFKSIERQLVLMASAIVQPTAHIVVKMKGIAEYGEWNATLPQCFSKHPKLRMKNRVATCNVEIRFTFCLTAKDLYIIEHTKHIVCRHLLKLGMRPKGIDITVLATLVASLCYMPLE